MEKEKKIKLHSETYGLGDLYAFLNTFFGEAATDSGFTLEGYVISYFVEHETIDRCICCECFTNQYETVDEDGTRMCKTCYEDYKKELENEKEEQ